MGITTLDEYIEQQVTQICALFGVPAAVVGPEPRCCPACGRPVLGCRAFYGRDPVHDNEIRAALPDLGIST